MMMSSVVVNPFLLIQTIFLLFCVYSFSPTISIRIHLGNETDRLSLLAFKNQLIDDPLQALSSWNESTPFCMWEGIICSHRHQRVVVLNLQSRALVGYVSPYIGNLSFLRVIALQNNTFRGNIPPEISHLSKLKALGLHNNSFEGQIPANLVQCSNLMLLYLYNNKFVGNIPSEFGSFTNLIQLLAGANDLTGRIPVALGNISTLQILNVGENHLDGSIPNTLGQLKNLTFFSLGLNMLSGRIPPSIYNLSGMQIFDVGSNLLQGSLPLSIGRDFPHLNIFYIWNNQFSGTLPVSLFTNASGLIELDVSNNSFAGQIPIQVGNLKKIQKIILQLNHFGSGGKNDDLDFITSLSNCTNLRLLSMARNNLGGRLPTSITNLSVTLTALHLGGNQIVGSIPFNMLNLKNLIVFDISTNSLTGTIPKEIGMLQKLQILGLGFNRLTGNIPNTIGNLTSLYLLSLADNMLKGNVEPNLGKCASLQKLYLDNNRLTGNIPKQILGSSSNLLEVGFSNNFLIGSLPQEIGQLKNLKSLVLSGNKLSSKIPTTIGLCVSLNELHLADNHFQGLIPYSFGDLVDIEVIDLSRNHLSGKIPKNLEKLRYLRYFNISFNDFEGEVPTKGIFQDVIGFSIGQNNKLCGGSDKLRLPKCHIHKLKKNKLLMHLKVTIGVLVSLSIIGTLLAFLTLHLRRKSSVKSTSKKHANELKRISYHEIREATNGFSSSNLIGIGSFASVYKGFIRDGGSVIAVKVFKLMERGTSKSFKVECEILKKIRHRNLLKILTVCSSIDYDGNDFKALIFEFMPCGSLEDWLHPSSDISRRSPKMLNLLQRLNIAIDVASALDYLHNCNDTPIVHCDLKPSNVLLNEDLIACVGDFGLAKFLSQSQSSLDKSESNSNIVRGTMGYIPPEYGMGSPISTKGDVYSYGIMLLEMVTGRRPTDEIFNDTLSLHSFCNERLVEQDIDMVNIIPLIEPFPYETEKVRSLMPSIKLCALSIIEVGVACSSESVSDRMDIKDVLMKMQKIKDAFVKIMDGEENVNMESDI